jgi:thiol-disulfide isomerase/thioredoxin
LSDENVDVRIYRPVDDFYNGFYCNDTISLKANMKYTYNINVENWGIVRCIFPNRRLDIYVDADSSVSVTYRNKEFIFGGRNASGNQFHNNDLFDYMVLTIRPTIDSIFSKYATNKSVDIKSIDNELENKVLLPTQALVNSICSDKISKGSNMCDFLKSETGYEISNKILDNYLDLLSSNELLSGDSIDSEIRLIMKRTPFSDKDIFKYIQGGIYAFKCLRYLYGNLSEEEKLKLISSRGADDFRAYKNYLLAPDNGLLSILFSSFVLQYQFGVNEFDRVRMFNYINKKYPASESVQIIKKYVHEELNDTTKVEARFLESESINTLSDISKTEEFNDKYVFIDLWATWCLPCRGEFLHNKRLYKLLSQYKNVGILYISIDENKKQWERDIESLKLSGHHLLASSKLIDNIKDILYDSNQIYIPRYILLNKDGDIVDKDLPRPSEVNILEEVLDKILK